MAHWRSKMSVGSGKFVDPLNLQDDDIHINDIAFSLGKTCRFNGHCIGHYSVAEHCVIMTKIVPEQARVWALMHDAAETYCGDLIIPIKRHLPEFNGMEDTIHEAIIRKYNINVTDEIHAQVKAADRWMGMKEIQLLFAKHPERDAEIIAAMTELMSEHPWLPSRSLRYYLNDNNSAGRTLSWDNAAASFKRKFTELVTDVPKSQAA